jgi:hypothetical protein
MYRDIDEDTLPNSSHIAPTRVLLPPKLLTWIIGSVQGDDSFTEILSWTLHIHILVSKYRYSVCSWSTVVGNCGRLDI